MDIKNYLKPIGRVLELGGIAGMLSSVAYEDMNHYDPSLGALFVGLFIRDSITKNKTIGNYVSLAGLAILANEAFLHHVTDNVNLGALVLGATSAIGGDIYNAIERKRSSREYTPQ